MTNLIETKSRLDRNDVIYPLLQLRSTVELSRREECVDITYLDFCPVELPSNPFYPLPFFLVSIAFTDLTKS
jgi:hypothetical protein